MRGINEKSGPDPYDAQVLESLPTFTEFLFELQMDEQAYKLALRTSISRTTFMFRRKPADIMLNAYNEPILQMWQANMDVQPITDPYQTAMYVASYIMKTQKGMSNLLRKVHNEQFLNTGLMIRQL